MSIYSITVTTEKGESYPLEKYKGNVLLIVNTATKCGLSGQFEELETLYKKYKDQGLVVLGFPSNQFKQELATGDEAAEACRLTYNVSFPMHEIITINGEAAHPLFQLLTDEAKGLLGKRIKWNFTKFLVSRDGDVVKRFAPTDSPLKCEADIQQLL